MATPITPQDVNQVPDFVIETFNELIKKNYRNKKAIVKTKDVVQSLIDKNISREDISNNRYLDIENIFRDVGWNVCYDQPGYNETFDAYFVFTPKV